MIVEYVPTETMVEIATTPTTPAPMSPPLFSFSWILLAFWLFCVAISYFSSLPTRLSATVATNALRRKIDELEKEVATLKVQLARTALSNAAKIGEIVRANDNDRTTLMSQHQSQLLSMSTAHGSDISTLKGQHQQQLSSLVDAHGKEICVLKDHHREEIRSLEDQMLLLRFRHRSELSQATIDLRRETVKERKLREKLEVEILGLESEVDSLLSEEGLDARLIPVKEEHAKETAKLTAKIDELERKIHADSLAFKIQRDEYTTTKRIAIMHAQKEAQRAKDEARCDRKLVEHREAEVNVWKSHWKMAKEADNKRQVKAARDKVGQGRKFAKLTRKLAFATKQITTMAKQEASQKLVEQNLRKELGELHAAISAKEQVTARAELAAAKPPARSRRGMLRESSGQVTAQKTWKAPESADAMSKLMEDHVAKQAHSAGLLRTTREEVSKVQLESAEAKHEAAQAVARATEAMEQLSVAQRRLEEVLAEASAAKASSDASKAQSEMQLEQLRRETAESKGALKAAKEEAETAKEEALATKQQLTFWESQAAVAAAEKEAVQGELEITKRLHEMAKGEGNLIATQARQALAEEAQKLNEANQTLDQTKMALGQSGGRIAELLAEGDAITRELETLRQEHAAMCTKASENFMQAENAQEELAKLREECTDLKNQKSMLLTQLARKAPPQQAANTDWQVREAVTDRQRQEQRAVSTVISALSQPATMSDLPNEWFMDPSVEQVISTFERDQLGGMQGTASVADDTLDLDLYDALSEELARDGPSQSAPNPPTATYTPSQPIANIVGSSHVVKSAPKVQPKPGGYRGHGDITGGFNSQPPAPSPPLPGIPRRSLPGIISAGHTRSFMSKPTRPFVFPSVPPKDSPLSNPSGRGRDGEDDEWELPKFGDLPANCEWYGQRPSGWRPDMSEGEERKLRLNGRMTQLRMMESEGIDVKARMAAVEKEVEAALIQWRAQPAAPEAAVKLVGNQLVYVDNTDYGSRGARTRPPNDHDKDITAFDTVFFTPPHVVTPEEQAMIDRRAKVAPKSRRPRPPPPPPPPPAPQT